MADSERLNRPAVKALLLNMFDYVAQRLDGRLAGLSDEEYLWQPVPDCMTLRETPEGLMPDSRRSAEEEAPPFTTIAWRLAHLANEVLRGEAEWIRAGEFVAFRQEGCPAEAETAIRVLGDSSQTLRSVIEAFPADRFFVPIGPTFGPFADDSYAALMMHILDEFIHHAAEIGVVRDLYAHTPHENSP